MDLPSAFANLPGILDEKNGGRNPDSKFANPVIEGSNFAYKKTNCVKIDDVGVKNAAQLIHQKLLSESYSPRTWRTHPLHICPAEPYDPADATTKLVLNWIFLISSLNFSFWSEKGSVDRFGVEWWEGWHAPGTKQTWSGYWSLVASLDRALETDNVPITDPSFYSSELLCPNAVIEHVFRPTSQSKETIPLLNERIAIMREVGFILCTSFGGSFQGFLADFQRRHNGDGTAMDLVQMVVETFPSFRDETWYEGRKVCLWKRAQILVAELWAAFYPADARAAHPLFPGAQGPAIGDLTMFADYRVPQILHHLRILAYPPALIHALREGMPLASGSREELSVRAASIVAVERVRDEIARLGVKSDVPVSSVLIDFFLWDLAKRVEAGEETIEGIDTADMVPIHRTRSIWY